MNYPIEQIDIVEEGIHKYGTPLIYKITSPTNKIYIGQSWNWMSRRSKYKNLHTENQPYIHRSLLKYGYENHIVEIQEDLSIDISQEELDNREIYWWQYYKDLGFEMLNCKEPGMGGRMSEETKKKQSIRSSGKNNPMYGKFGKDHPAFGKKAYFAGKGKEAHPCFGRTGTLSHCFGRTGEKHPMFGKTGDKSPFAKKVINNKTGEIFLSAKEAATALKIDYNTLTQHLRDNEDVNFHPRKHSLNYID